jgi:hypothetical protein
MTTTPARLMRPLGGKAIGSALRRRRTGPLGWFVLLATIFVFAGCAGPSAARPAATATIAATAPIETGSPGPDHVARAPCEDGRLLVGDLSRMDQAWQVGLEVALAKARAWQADARLTRLRVGCQLFQPGFRWQATFYSERAQTFFASDTGETEPAEVAPADVPALPTQVLSFGLLRRSLAKSGFEDGDMISPSTGVDIRVNSTSLPFGPPSAPRGVVIYHVAVERLGETKDIFVDATDGTVYRYTSP